MPIPKKKKHCYKGFWKERMDESWNICSRAVHRLVHTLILRWCQIQLMSNAFWPKILEWLCWYFFYIVKHVYHEPVARGIGRPPPVYLTLNKLSYLILCSEKDLQFVTNRFVNFGVKCFMYWMRQVWFWNCIPLS